MTHAPQNGAETPRPPQRRRQRRQSTTRAAATDATAGRVVRVTLSLDAASVAWAREQAGPGGLSGLLERLLADARRSVATTEEAGDDNELRAAFTRLLDRKLRHGLAEAEELVLADLRARLNGHADEIAELRTTLTDLSHLQPRK